MWSFPEVSINSEKLDARAFDSVGNTTENELTKITTNIKKKT
jgi:hypothetical protein